MRSLKELTVTSTSGSRALSFCANSIQAPDYRAILLDGTEFLVEVKNHRPKDAVGKFVLTSQYLASVQTYAKTCSRELFFAIYWSQAKLWTLVPDHAFEMKGDKFFITLQAAMKCNQMDRLGDFMVGTLPSLILKFFSDPGKPRSIGVDGMAGVTIGRVELFCGGNLLLEPKETEIAWFFLNYGQWPVEQLEPEIEDGNLISFGFRSSPSEESSDDNPFRMVGFLSQMISRQYNTITSSEGKIDLLAPNIGPDRLGVVIPADFKSDRLPLWLFRVHSAVK